MVEGIPSDSNIDDANDVWSRGRQCDDNDVDDGGIDDGIDRTPVVGIDLGTSNSCVGIWSPLRNRAKVIKRLEDKVSLNYHKSTIIPSTVTFTGYNNDFSSYVIGCNYEHEYTVSGIKSILGYDYSKINQYQCNVKDIYSIDDSNVMICCKNKSGNERMISPIVLTSYILKELKSVAEDYLSRKSNRVFHKKTLTRYSMHNVTRAVIGVPATYSILQKQIIKQAALMAGFKDVYFMVESSAAAMSYGLLVAGRKNVLVTDIGGGTTDLTILKVDGGRYYIENTYGVSNCGGRRIDRLVYEYVFNKLIESKYLIKVSSNSSSNAEDTKNHSLLMACCRCKEALTSKEEDYIDITAYTEIEGYQVNKAVYFADSRGVRNSSNIVIKIHSRKGKSAAEAVDDDVMFKLTRLEFKMIINPVLTSIENSIKQCFTDWKNHSSSNNTSMNDSIDEVVLVGGSSRIPSIREAISDSIISQQAAFKKELCTSVNADETVCQGLAIRGGVIMGDSTSRLKNILMMDALPSSIGLMMKDLATNEDVFDPILFKGDFIPVVKSKVFPLATPKQTHISLDIYEEIDDYDAAGAIRVIHRCLGTYNVAVPKATNSSASSISNSQVKVVFTMNVDAMFSYKVKHIDDPDDGNDNHVMENRTIKSNKNIDTLLLISICVLISLYLFSKILLNSNIVISDNANLANEL